jgi:DNA-binding protein WhiA
VRARDHLPGAGVRRSRWSARPGGSAIAAKAREVRGVDRVVVKDGDAIARPADPHRRPRQRAVLGGARVRREVRATANRLANFDDANLRRSARAAVAAAAPGDRALEILGDDAPWHLTSAGALRLEHKQASLEELGRWPTRR